MASSRSAHRRGRVTRHPPVPKWAVIVSCSVVVGLAVVWVLSVNVASFYGWWKLDGVVAAVFFAALGCTVVVNIAEAINDGLFSPGWLLRFRGSVAGFSTSSLTDLATLLAGRGRPALRAEWRA